MKILSYTSQSRRRPILYRAGGKDICYRMQCGYGVLSSSAVCLLQSFAFCMQDLLPLPLCFTFYTQDPLVPCRFLLLRSQ
jgi:hypothetical protein